MLIRPMMMGLPVAGAGAAPAGWNENDKDIAITLSNNFLTAERNSDVDTEWRGVRGKTRRSSGKLYFEMLRSVTASSAVYGIATPDATLMAIGGSGRVNVVISNGTLSNNNASRSNYSASLAANDRASIAVDLDAGLFWFAKNGVWQSSGNPSAGTGGVSISLGSYHVFYGAIVAGEKTILNTGLTAFAYAPPSGFLPWG